MTGEPDAENNDDITLVNEISIEMKIKPENEECMSDKDLKTGNDEVKHLSCVNGRSEIHFAEELKQKEDDSEIRSNEGKSNCGDDKSENKSVEALKQKEDSREIDPEVGPFICKFCKVC